MNRTCGFKPQKLLQMTVWGIGEMKALSFVWFYVQRLVCAGDWSVHQYLIGVLHSGNDVLDFTVDTGKELRDSTSVGSNFVFSATPGTSELCLISSKKFMPLSSVKDILRKIKDKKKRRKISGTTCSGLYM